MRLLMTASADPRASGGDGPRRRGCRRGARCDLHPRRLVGVTLNKRGFLAGRSHDALPVEAIHAIGQDAVMVLDQSSLVAPQDAPDDGGHPLPSAT